MAPASAEKLKHTEPAENETVASAPHSKQLEKTSEWPLLEGKGAEPSVQIVRGGGVNVSESRTLARKLRVRAGARDGEGQLQTEGKRRGNASKENLLRRKHDRVKEPKALQKDLESLGFTSRLAKPIIGKKVGKRRTFP